jgi:prolyl-tRNA synthetase
LQTTRDKAMRYSQTFIPTVKETPADAECISHKLMIRAGLARKVASGTYTYLPLGWRSLLKIITIVRDEMNKAGAQEILVPSMQPLELWQKTGRSIDYGPTMFHLEDRHGKGNVLGPTAEEVVTYLAAGEIKSYKQMPVNLYQISAKFRDEFRPRFGPIRSREFIMKDAYSFDAGREGLDQSYKAMYDAYCRIFNRCGLEYVIVEAEVGEMGGSDSHQFTIPCESGEDTIVYTEDGSYAANLERAAVDPVPKQQASGNVPAPEEVHTPNIGSIEAVCAFLGTKPKDMIKTLIFSVGQDAIAALVRGDHELNVEKLSQSLGGKHVELAE